MRVLYNFSIYFFTFIIWIISLFNPKAKKWISGRKKQFKNISKALTSEDRVVWFHCASLGEFEQGKPVIESVRKNFPHHKILLTFFSPSGYEVRKNTEIADYVFYLPVDTKKNAQKFIRIVNPRIAIFIKYEFWFNFINELSKNKIPTLVISAIFRSTQYFFKPWGYWPSGHLQKITYFFVQDETSLELLNKINVFHAEISGDTRFDRVIQLASEKRSYPEVEQFGKNKKLIVAGSTWPADEEILAELIRKLPDYFGLVIAPHEVNKERIMQLMKKFDEFHPQKYSDYDMTKTVLCRVLIIDNVGLLSFLYRYSMLAYVGGGFGVGIHNILEATTYGLPVIFGPNYKKFREAMEWIDMGVAFSFVDSKECILKVRELLEDKVKYEKTCKDALEYVQENAGATNLVLDKVKSYLIAD
jgi:3-deoxy-D-manno-octulosonic-acid transferase